MKRFYITVIAALMAFACVSCDNLFSKASKSDKNESLLLLALLFGSGQTDVWVGGNSTNASDVQVPGYWKNGVWNALEPIDVTKDSWCSSIVVVRH